jgi:putative toxin-antitoxin system antitoxin component (TIGR02293 family)
MYIVSPRTTLLRREREGVLSPEESERLERVARLTALAEHVLESSADAQQFLTSPHPLLDGDAPIDLAATDLGARRVENVLWQLEYGLPV